MLYFPQPDSNFPQVKKHLSLSRHFLSTYLVCQTWQRLAIFWESSQHFQRGNITLLKVVGATEGVTKEAGFKMHLARSTVAVRMPLSLSWRSSAASQRTPIRMPMVRAFRRYEVKVLDARRWSQGVREGRVWSWVFKEEEPGLVPRRRECVQVGIMPEVKATK